jgi:hypothetical protein
MSVPGGERCIRRCLETGHTGAAMVVMSTEARTSKKAAIDRSEGSERRRQQEFVGRGRSDQREFESFSPTSEDHTNANFVLYSHAKLGVEG